MLEGLAPYRIRVEPFLFLSDRGDISARLEATYELLLTQRLVAQPRFETNVAARDVKKFGVAVPRVPCKEYCSSPVEFSSQAVSRLRLKNRKLLIWWIFLCFRGWHNLCVHNFATGWQQAENPRKEGKGIDMKKRILAVTAVLGLSVLVAGIGPAFAGGNEPQEHRTWQYEEAIETGTLPPSDAEKRAVEVGARPSSQAGSDSSAFDVDPRWKESGGE